jgi:hypothetical protein
MARSITTESEMPVGARRAGHESRDRSDNPVDDGRYGLHATFTAPPVISVPSITRQELHRCGIPTSSARSSTAAGRCALDRNASSMGSAVAAFVYVVAATTPRAACQPERARCCGERQALATASMAPRDRRDSYVAFALRRAGRLWATAFVA